MHFVPAKLHFVKKTFRLIENLLWYKYSRQRGRQRTAPSSNGFFDTG